MPGIEAAAVVDPTACDDAFRAGMLYGLERAWSVERSVQLVNPIGAIKITVRGPPGLRMRPPQLAG